MANRSDGFYSTKEWFKTRTRVLKAANYTCAMCGVSVHGKHNGHVDHILPRRDRPDLALTLSNLQVLCTHHHNSTKQSMEANSYKEAIDENGYPESWR